MDQVEKRIQEVFGDDTNAFKNLLEITGAVISGSFIIQAILDETWDKSDIDVFIPIRNMKSPSDNPSSEIEEWLLNDVKTPMRGYYAACRYGANMTGGHHIQWIRNFELNGSMIQLVHVDVTADEIEQYILNSFDFSICKNVYSVDKLVVTDMDGILTKSFNFAYAGNIFGSIRRMQKYSERGFKIAFNNKRKLIKKILAIQDDQDDFDQNDQDYFLFQCNRNIDEYHRKRFTISNMSQNHHIIKPYTEKKIFKNLHLFNNSIWGNCNKSSCIFSNILSSHFHINSELSRGPRHELIVFNDPFKKDLKKTAKLSKRLKILCSMPKYIKMDILETTTELTLWELYNLIE
jgi:hypothetical protein